MLPNGPEMATAFVSVAACATTAPLNPAYRAEELEFYLGDIGAKAILVGEDESRPGGRGRRAAGHRGPAPRPSTRATPAGTFTLDGPAGRTGGGDRRWPRTATSRCLLHTSGTTSRPKLVPLSHANLAASAAPYRRDAQR